MAGVPTEVCRGSAAGAAGSEMAELDFGMSLGVWRGVATCGAGALRGLATAGLDAPGRQFCPWAACTIAFSAMLCTRGDLSMVR